MRKPRKIGPHQIKTRQYHSFNITMLWACCLTIMALLNPQAIFASNTQAKSESETKHLGTQLTANQLRAEISAYLDARVTEETLPAGQTLTYNIEQLDFRISLNSCNTPLAITPYHQGSNRFSGRMTLQVTCQSPKPWRLFVPVRFSRTDRVVVTTQPITRRTTLSKSMLSYKQQDVSSLSSGYYRDIDAVAGYESKHFIQQGQILSPHHIIPPRMIQRQQEVTIISQSSRISVKATGIALSDGKVGDRIKVKNKKSQRIIEAEVGGAGLVYASP